MALDDLDALIGDLRKEAARRRASPDFPIDEEARLAVEMDRQGPSGGSADLPAVLAGLRALAGRTQAPGQGGGASPTDELAELAELTRSAAATLAARLGDVERRLGRLAPDRFAEGTLGAGSPGGDHLPDLSHWDGVVVELAATACGRTEGGAPGRVLVAGPGAARWTGLLASHGLDAYGVDPVLPAYSDEGPVRAGGVAAHLQTVGEGALTLAVLAGPLAAAEMPHLDRWAAALAVRAGTVVVVSEAPWSWRRRLGEPAADTSAWRPAAPETWMAVLDAAGYHLTGRYGPSGRDYCLAGSTAAGVEVPAR